RRTSEETPKKLWSGKGPDKTRAGRTENDGVFQKYGIYVKNYDYILRFFLPSDELLEERFQVIF
ncbi:hypothetical protein, partial [uncultured Bacteroides sp.]|uniref:hypothetical protein n=1 Tax=uncultured Bacteroides sp. TaxID=162156 RepID=UPI00260C9CCE